MEGVETPEELEMKPEVPSEVPLRSYVVGGSYWRATPRRGRSPARKYTGAAEYQRKAKLSRGVKLGREVSGFQQGWLTRDGIRNRLTTTEPAREQGTMNRPALTSQKRRVPEEWVEGREQEANIPV